MSGGEPSSIKRDNMCREGAGSERMLAESISWCLFLPSDTRWRREGISSPWTGGGRNVPGSLPQMAAQDLFRRGGSGPHHRDPAPPGCGGPAEPRLSLHRHPGHRQDHLRQDPGQSGELPPPGERRPLQPVRRLPWHRQRQHAGRAGAGRRLQQRRGPRPGPPGRGRLLPRQRPLPGVYRGRGPHAQHRGLQRPAEDPGGASGPPHLHPGHHGAPQGARHHPLPVPALRLQAHPARGHRGASAVCGRPGRAWS